MEGFLTDKTSPISINFAIPDHPWVDNSDGAAVRIAMTVAQAGTQAGLLAKLKHEWQSADGEIEVETEEEEGVVNSDLTVGADVTSVSSLRANEGMSLLGVKFYGQGFVLNAEDAASLSATSSRPLIKHFVGGQDLTQRPRELSVVDANGLGIEDLISTYPDAYQHL